MLLFVLVDSFSFHGNLMLVSEGNSVAMYQRLRHSVAFVQDTSDQDLELLSSRNNRTYLHHIRYEETLPNVIQVYKFSCL